MSGGPDGGGAIVAIGALVRPGVLANIGLRQ
jgi:hypothetical protein